MGLLELLQQGQTQLSAGSFPGDTPIYDPQSGFVQSNLPDFTYEDETLGQPDNGSVLASTTSETSLDLTDLDQNTSTPPPIYDWVTNYPALASGEFNGAPSLYELIYTANNTYLNNVSIEDSNSPQVNTLDKTGLDSPLTEYAPTTFQPNAYSAPTNYPGNATGRWKGASMDFIAPWSSGFTYVSNLFNNNNATLQQDTLDKTSLDNTHMGNVSTTVPTPNSTSYPNTYPALVSGEFNGAPIQYLSPYDTYNTYLNSVPIETPNSPQINTLSQTGLDNTDNDAEQTTTTPNSVSAPNDYPELVSGKLNGPPSQYESQYKPNNTYLDNVFNNESNINTDILGQTGLDNSNLLSAQTTTTPNSISYPNNYPALVSGEFNGSPSPYETPYDSTNTYLSNVPIQNVSSPQLNTLEQTGLDLIDNESLPTTIIPDSISYPNNYPAIEGANLGGFGGPEQYNTNWNQDNTYLNTFNQDSENSIQFSFTGSNLDNSSEGVSTLSHVTPPVSLYKPNNYPILPHVNLGEFNAGPSQYVTPYSSSNTYLAQYDELKNITTNPQINTLDETGLDVENSDALETSLLFAPTNPDTYTSYPAITGVNLGVTGSGAKPFNQIFKPSNTYWNSYLTNRLLFDTLIT
jgi:hypothetical protein